MSYTKLFEIHNIGLSSSNMGKLLEKFNNFNINSYITKDEIQKSITQKKLIDNIINFLIANNIIEIVEDNKEFYKVVVEFPSTHKEKEFELYKNQKLYLSQKTLITKKLKSYIKKIGYIVKLDLANSTSNSGNVKLKDSLLNIEFPNFVKKSIQKYFYANKGYLIAQYGDEAFLFFFEERDAKRYLNSMIEEYKETLSLEFKKYNQNLETIQDKLYLKVFLANSIISNLIYDDYNLPSFENMGAMKYISRVEKPFKEQILKIKNINVDKFFIVSDIKLDEYFIEEKILSEDKTSYMIFYKIDNSIEY